MAQCPGDAVTAGLLGSETAAAIRFGLGEPADGVTEETLNRALAGLIEECEELNADQARKAAMRTRDEIDAGGIAARAEAKRARQYWKQWVKPDGMVHGEYELDPENGAFVRDVFDQLTSPRRGGPRFVDPTKKAWAVAIAADPRTTERIAVDGFVELLRIGAAADPGTVFGGNRPAVKILVTQNALPGGSGSTSDGGVGSGAIEGNTALIPLDSVERHLCTDGYVPIAFDDDHQCVNVGREKRLFTARQRQGLAARDGGCLWPDCDRPPSWTEAHHIDHWKADEGRTDIADGVLLCKSDHLRLHNQGWRIDRRTGSEYWLVPPATIDPEQTPIRLHSKAPLRPGNPIRPAAPAPQENSA
jgi:hypothetical protein